MNLCCSTVHRSVICLVIFAMVIMKNVEADLFHYYKLKKFLTAVALAKALTHKKPTIVPVPIPIPIPIQQNEIISLPSSSVKKIIHSGRDYPKHQGSTSVVLKGGNSDLLSLGSSIHGSSSYGYGLANTGRFSRGNSRRRYPSLSKLLSLPGVARANSVKIIHMDPLTDAGGLGNQFPRGMNSLGGGGGLGNQFPRGMNSLGGGGGLGNQFPRGMNSLGGGGRFIAGSNHFLDSNNVLDGKLLMGGGGQFPIDGDGYGIGSGGLSLGNNNFFDHSLPLPSLYNSMSSDSFLNSYNPATNQNFMYSQGPKYPYKRRRRRNKRKNNSYRTGTRPRPQHIQNNHINNQDYPPQAKPPLSPQSLEAETTITLEVGEKWRPPTIDINIEK